MSAALVRAPKKRLPVANADEILFIGKWQMERREHDERGMPAIVGE